jgi:hypothetical protein
MMYRLLSRGTKKNVQIREMSMAVYSFNAEGKKTTRLREMLEKKDLAFLMYVVVVRNFFLSVSLSDYNEIHHIHTHNQGST